MRRRRLIGMYRVLLKSMNLVCSADKGCDPRRSCREGQERETEQEPGLKATYPIALSSTIDPGISERVLPVSCDLETVVLTILSGYLSAQEGCRNAGLLLFGIEIGTL